MSPEYSFRSVGLALAVAGTIACGSGGDTRAPLTITGPSSGEAIRITVTNGVTNAPVTQARVTVGADTMVTDATGQLDVATASPCLPATIDADGYLERRVLCLGATEPQGRAAVTLWPVASDAERAALQAFAFRGGMLVRAYDVQVELSRDLVNSDAVMVTWQRAGQALATTTEEKARIRFVLSGDDGVRVAPWSGSADCSDTSFEWHFSVAGFCYGQFIGLFQRSLHLAPSLMENDGVALRALLYELGLRPHQLPGLLNETQPAAAMSDFEARTLRMIGLRSRPFPRGVAWPDTES